MLGKENGGFRTVIIPIGVIKYMREGEQIGEADADQYGDGPAARKGCPPNFPFIFGMNYRRTAKRGTGKNQQKNQPSRQMCDVVDHGEDEPTTRRPMQALLIPLPLAGAGGNGTGNHDHKTCVGDFVSGNGNRSANASIRRLQGEYS